MMGNEGRQAGCEEPPGGVTRAVEGPGPGYYAPSRADAPSGRGRRSRRGKKGDLVVADGEKGSECLAAGEAEEPAARAGPAGECGSGSVPGISPREGPVDSGWSGGGVAGQPRLKVIQVFSSSAEVEVREEGGAEDSGGAIEAVEAASHRPQDQVQIKLNGQVQAGQKVSDDAAAHGRLRVTVPLPALEEGRNHRIEARVRRGARGAWTSWSSVAEMTPSFIAKTRASTQEHGGEGKGGDEPRGSRAHHFCQGRCDAGAQTEELLPADLHPRRLFPTPERTAASVQTQVSLPSHIPVSIFARCSAVEQQPEFDQEVPDEFVCPITCEIIREPVVALDGFVYEKDAIESWFTQSNRSPTTNEPLDSIMTVPCHTLRSLIQDFVNAHPNAEPVVLL